MINRECSVCGVIMMADEPDEAHTAAACQAWARDSVFMKSLLAVAVKEAVHLALIDSVGIDLTDEQREAARWNVHAIPGKVFARMDPDALAQNVSVRLLGSGGWFVNGVYSGNATPQEVFDATIQRPDRDSIAETVFDLGLGPPT